MLGEIERLNENELDNSQVRILIAAERAPIDHHSTNIDRLYRYWQERHLIDGNVPAESDFHPPSRAIPLGRCFSRKPDELHDEQPPRRRLRQLGA